MSLRNRLINIKHKRYLLHKSNNKNNVHPTKLVRGNHYTIISPTKENKYMRYVGLERYSISGDIIYIFTEVITREVEYYKKVEYEKEWTIIERD